MVGLYPRREADHVNHLGMESMRRRWPDSFRAVYLMEWMPPPDGIAMCQGGDVCTSHE